MILNPGRIVGTSQRQSRVGPGRSHLASLNEPRPSGSGFSAHNRSLTLAARSNAIALGVMRSMGGVLAESIGQWHNALLPGFL